MQTAPLDYEALTRELVTKSDKIRTLGRAGVPTGEIARFLGIRYQHARNVLADAGLHSRRRPAPAPQSPPAQPVEEAKDNPAASTSAWLQIDEAGRLELPPALLAHAGLAKNRSVYVGATDEGLELLSQAAALLRAQRIVARHKRPGVSEVDAFLADRRKMWGEE